jgi:hypothetical protein
MKSAATWGGIGKAGRLLACLILVAFTLQSYVAQTHIHDAGPASIGKALDAPVLNKAPGGKSPLDNSPVDCPFCQAVAHDGIFFIPASPLLFLSSVWIEMAAPIVRLAASSGERAHNWQSRAPPLH